MHLYGLIIGISVVIYYNFTFKEWVKADLKKGLFILLFLQLIIFSLFGARLYHVADNWGYYKVTPSMIPQIWQGGLGIMGALLFGFLFMFFLTKKYRLSFFSVLNIFTTHLLLALGLGRLANLFSEGGFWLESIPLLFVYIIFITNKRIFFNFSISYFLISYGVIRIITDHFRTDIWLITNILPVSTVIAVLMVLGGLVMVIIQRFQSKGGGQNLLPGCPHQQ